MLDDVLETFTPSPVVQLDRAVAIALRDGPAAGLRLIDQLGPAPELGGYHALPAARAAQPARTTRRSG